MNFPGKDSRACIMSYIMNWKFVLRESLARVFSLEANNENSDNWKNFS